MASQETAEPPRPQGQGNLVACPKCSALNSPNASYCIGCGSFLPLPPSSPSQYGAPQEKKFGLTVPMILLIIAIILAIVIPLLLFSFFTVVTP